MSHTRKSLFIIFIVIIMIFSASLVANAASGMAVKKDVPIFLKLGQYNVLYSYPKEPFAVNNRLMVSVRSVHDLMGGEITYNNATQAVTIGLLEHSYVLTAGSEEAIVDGKSIIIDTKPVFVEKSLYIPIYVLLHNSDIKWQWDQSKHQLEINDERAVQGEAFSLYSATYIESMKNENALQLMTYSLVPENVNDSIFFHYKIAIRAKNISGHDIGPGYPVIINLIPSGNGIAEGFNHIPWAIKNNGETVFTFEYSEMKDDYIKYIICLGCESNFDSEPVRP